MTISAMILQRSSARKALEGSLVLDQDVLSRKAHPTVRLEVAEGADQTLLGSTDHARQVLTTQLRLLLGLLEPVVQIQQRLCRAFSHRGVSQSEQTLLIL